MTETAEMIDPMTGEIIDQKELAEALLEQAREQGVNLRGPGGLLAGLTKNVRETALEATPSAGSRRRSRRRWANGPTGPWQRLPGGLH